MLKYSIFLFIFLFLFGCRNKGHHLLQDVRTSVYHEKDTIGWNAQLQLLHGVWVKKKYTRLLNQHHSISKANAFYAEEFTSLNIDTRRFRGDSLEITAIGPQDYAGWHTVLDFQEIRDENDQLLNQIILLETTHPTYNNDYSTTFVVPDVLVWDTILVLNTILDGASITSDMQDVFIKVSNQVSHKSYQYDLLKGVEVYVRDSFLVGQYNVYDADTNLIKRNVGFANDGTLVGTPFTKYHPMGWGSFDVLLFEGMSPLEEQRISNKYYGLVLHRKGFNLHHIIFDPKGLKPPLLGKLRFQLRRRKN